MTTRTIHPLTSAIAALVVAMSVTACGSGGGSKTVSDPGTVVPPTTPPTTPPPTPPPTTPPVNDPYAYKGVADNALIATHVKQAQDAGFTGKGVKLAVLDGGLLGAYAPLDNRLIEYRDFTLRGPGNPTATRASHGMVVAAFAGGAATDGFAGGVAPESGLYLGQVCAEDMCDPVHTTRAIDAFAAQGVQIFNITHGHATVDGSALMFGSIGAAADRAGALVVAASGDHGAGEPVTPANLPSIAPGYRNNWLAVGNVAIGSNGQPTGLDSSSNHCGSSAELCLVAPGTNSMLPVAGSDSAGKTQINSTAISSAIVSGVAAQVWQAFPWMTAKNVQQTVLTTATDLGDAGVDRVYGWGLVNAEKAVKGPAAFTTGWGIGPDIDTTFSNDISGPGSLTMNGDGRLTLAGNNTYTGSTTVLSGTINLTGSITSDVLVGNSATFESHGGYIHGSYSVVNTTGNTVIQLGKPLDVSSFINIKGNLILLPEEEGYRVTLNEKVMISRRPNGVNGGFNSLQYANGFFWTGGLTYDHNAVIANLTRASATTNALAIAAPQSVINGARQADVLVAELDGRISAGDVSLPESITASAASLLAAPDDAVASSLTSLTGQIHGTQRTLAVQAGLNDLTNAADRLPALRSTERATFWAQVEGTQGDLEREGYAKATYDTRGMTVGIDAPFGHSGAIAGMSLTSSRTKGRVPEGASRLESDRVALTAYGYQPFGNMYVSGALGYGTFDVDATRLLVIGQVQERVAAQRDDTLISGRVEAGYNAGLVTPFVALGALGHRQGGFSETAPSGLGLSAGADTLTTQFGEIGVRSRFTHGAWSLDGGLVHRTVYSGRDTGFQASFNGLTGTDFDVAGQSVSKDGLRGFFGATYRITPDVWIYGNATYERGGAAQSNTAGNIGLRWAL